MKTTALIRNALFATCLLLASRGGVRASTETNSAAEAPPATPREFYNAGTDKLRQGKLKEAETLLESVLNAQDQRLQPLALYNLGHVRFVQGAAELKKGPAGEEASARGQMAEKQETDAARQVDEALAGNDEEKMLEAYLRGRGAQKELSAAVEAVRHAMETYGAALAKWQRASGDFKSAAEMNPADLNAQTNSEVMDRYIAKLIDRIKQMQRTCTACSACEKGTRLNDKLKGLKGRIPKGKLPQSNGQEEQEDQSGPQQGQQEGPSRQGNEMTLSPEQAAWLLEGFKLGGDRKLPMGQETLAPPNGRSRPDW